MKRVIQLIEFLREQFGVYVCCECSVLESVFNAVVFAGVVLWVVLLMPAAVLLDLREGVRRWTA